MKKKKQIILTCIISIFIFVVLFYFLSFSSKEKAKKLYLLKTDIASGTLINKEMIEEIFLPINNNLMQACSDEKKIIGSYILSDMKKGDLISNHDLQISDSGVIYPMVAEGKVLYTMVLKPEEANGWWIQKGNEIIIYIQNEKPTGPTVNQTGLTETDDQNSVVILENIKIVRIMDELGAEMLPGSKKQPEIVCLEVTDKQAQKIFTSERDKKIKLLAKNFNLRK